jgi:hypothetical protein
MMLSSCQERGTCSSSSRYGAQLNRSGDPKTGAPTLNRRKAHAQRPSAKKPERSLLGILARTAHWIEWWRRFGLASGLRRRDNGSR